MTAADPASDGLPAQRFLESSWDYCIVLDACRYDVFAAVYDDYLDGDLGRRRSPGSSTPEWASRTFTGDHDLAYFSGNPFINDLGIPLDELAWGSSGGYAWTANEHISRVVDVWREGWDEELGTVPPASLAASLNRHADAAAAADRVVLHYMQPHAPYLSRGRGGKLSRIQESVRTEGASGSRVLDAVGDRVRPWLERTFEGSEIVQKAGLWLEMDPIALAREGTREAGLALHEENLRVALDAIADLLPRLDGSVVVTADHGEAFGESGVWEHHVETHIPALVEVPWLEVA